MLEVGVGLVPLVDASKGGQLLTKVKALRKHLATQLGFLVPSIHITDNLTIKDLEYVIHLRGVEIARWEMRRDCLLAISSQPNPPALAGVDTRDPAFGAPAKWISKEQQAQALAAGYAVVDQTAALATHLGEIIRQNAHELLSRHETKRLIDRLSESHPKLVEELVPKLMTLGEVQRVLQQLLREQVSIRDLGTILETLIETAGVSKNPVLLNEAVRHALGRGAGPSAAGRARRAQSGHARSRHRRRVQPGSRGAVRQRGQHGPAALHRPSRSGGPAYACLASMRSALLPYCCAHHRAAFTCAGCWNLFCPRSWCWRRLKSRRWCRCSRWVRCGDESKLRTK